MFLVSALLSLSALVMCFIELNLHSFVGLTLGLLSWYLWNSSWNEILEKKAEEAEYKFQYAREQNIKKIMEQNDNYFNNN